MEHLEVSHLFAMLVVMLGVAKVGGSLAQRIGQPAVLGELVGGVIVGQSGFHLVDSGYETVHMLSELGVFILLLAIGLETDLRMLLRVGTNSLAVAVVGVVLPLGLGYLACRLLGLSSLVAIMAGAALTATSVGITARVLSDLGRLRDVEGQIILGAAVIDDILGLVVLTVVTIWRGRAGYRAQHRGDSGCGLRLSRCRLARRPIRRSLALTRHADDRPSRHADDHGFDPGLRSGMAGREVGVGDDPRSLRRRPAPGVGSAG